MSDVFHKRLWPIAGFVSMLLALALLLACGSVEQVGGAPLPEPELRLDVQTEEVGPSRTDVRVLMTNVGSADVLVEMSFTIPSNAGSVRDSGPTRPAKITNENGREVGGNAGELKTMTWVPERLRVGTTLTWVVALRCFDPEAVDVAVGARSVEVGGVREASFEAQVREAQVKCPLPRSPGS